MAERANAPSAASAGNPANHQRREEGAADAIELLAGLLPTTRLTLLLGAVGSGKTTLLTGDVVPTLGSGPGGARQLVIVLDTSSRHRWRL